MQLDHCGLLAKTANHLLLVESSPDQVKKPRNAVNNSLRLSQIIVWEALIGNTTVLQTSQGEEKGVKDTVRVNVNDVLKNG